MAYGFLATNSSSDTVINDTDPTMVSVRSGSKASYTTLGGNNQFREDVSDNIIPGSDEMVLIEVPVSSWIMHSEGYVDPTSKSGDFTSNMDPINYTVVGSRADLANPTGYGMAVYDSLGQCVWDDASEAARLLGGGVIPGSTITNLTYSLTVNSTANAIFLQGGTTITDSVSGDRAGVRATRISSTQWEFEMEFYSNVISTNLVVEQRDLFYMFAQID